MQSFKSEAQDELVSSTENSPGFFFLKKTKKTKTKKTPS